LQRAGHGFLRFDPDDIALSGPYVEEWCLGSCECPDGGGPAFPADQIIGDLTISRTGTFSWSTSGRALVITGTEFSYSVGSSALSDEFLTITDDDVPTSGTTTLSGAVDDNVLTIASADGCAGRVFFPTTWIRE